MGYFWECSESNGEESNFLIWTHFQRHENRALTFSSSEIKYAILQPWKKSKENIRYPKQSALEFSARISTSDLSHLSQFCQGLLTSRAQHCQGPFKMCIYQVWGLFFLPFRKTVLIHIFHIRRLPHHCIPTHFGTSAPGPQSSIQPHAEAGSRCFCPAATAEKLLFVVRIIFEPNLLSQDYFSSGSWSKM